MKRLTKEIETLTRNIGTLGADPEIPVNVREEFELTCIARDAAALDRRLDRALGDFLGAVHRKRITQEELGRATRRACIFAVGAHRDNPQAARRTLFFRRVVRRTRGAGGVHGLAPEVLDTIGAMEGERAAIQTLKLAKALRVYVEADAAAGAARQAYTHLLETASSLAVTLRSLNRSLDARLAAAGGAWLRAAA